MKSRGLSAGLLEILSKGNLFRKQELLETDDQAFVQAVGLKNWEKLK